MNTKNEKTAVNDNELEAVTGGTEPGEWSIPENGLPRPGRNTEPQNDLPEWSANGEWESEIPEALKPGTYEIYGVVWGQD